MGLDHPDPIFGTILDVYTDAGSTRTNSFIDNSRPCDHIRNLCGSSHNTPKFVTHAHAHVHVHVHVHVYIVDILDVRKSISIVLLAMSDQYATFILIFCHKIATNGHFYPFQINALFFSHINGQRRMPKMTLNHIPCHIRSICNFVFDFFSQIFWIPENHV